VELSARSGDRESGGTSIVAFGLSLANTNDRNQACADCGHGLGASGRVSFAMVRTTLGVADDDEGGATVS